MEQTILYSIQFESMRDTKYINLNNCIILIN